MRRFAALVRENNSPEDRKVSSVKKFRTLEQTVSWTCPSLAHYTVTQVRRWTSSRIFHRLSLSGKGSPNKNIAKSATASQSVQAERLSSECDSSRITCSLHIIRISYRQQCISGQGDPSDLALFELIGYPRSLLEVLQHIDCAALSAGST